MARHADRCHLDRKSIYRTYEAAASVAAGLEEPGRPYWCPTAGGYHITRQSAVENARRVAADRARERITRPRAHPYTPAVDIPADQAGNRPCICGRALTNQLHDEIAVAAQATSQAEHRRRIGDTP